MPSFISMVERLKNMRRQRNAYRRALLKLLQGWGSKQGITYQDGMDALEVVVKFKR